MASNRPGSAHGSPMKMGQTPARDGRTMRVIVSSSSIEGEVLGTKVKVRPLTYGNDEDDAKQRDKQDMRAAASPGGFDAAAVTAGSDPDASEGGGGGKARPSAGRLVMGDGQEFEFTNSVFGACEGVEGVAVWAVPRWAEDELSQPDSVRGKVVIVYRGMPPGAAPGSLACSFLDKTYRCMRAGAAAVIIVNTEDKPLAPTGKTQTEVPVVCVSKTDGEALREGVIASIEFEDPHDDPFGMFSSSMNLGMAADHAQQAMDLSARLNKDFRARVRDVAIKEGISMAVAIKIAESSMHALQDRVNGLTESLKSTHGMVMASQDVIRDAEIASSRVATAMAESMRIKEESAAGADENAQSIKMAKQLEGVTLQVEGALRRQLEEERAKVKVLEETVYRPDVQSLLFNSNKAKPVRKTLLDKFEGGGTNSVVSVAFASDILGKARPSELGGAADMLTGKAGELAGTEDEQIIRMRQKLRHRVSAKWFSQWYDLVNWRGLQKVLRSLLEEGEGEGVGKLLHVESLVGSFNVELGYVQQENLELTHEANLVRKQINQKNDEVLAMKEQLASWEAEAEEKRERERGEERERGAQREAYWEGVVQAKDGQIEQAKRDFEAAQEKHEQDKAELAEQIAEGKTQVSLLEQRIEQFQQRLLEAEAAKEAAVQKAQKAATRKSSVKSNPGSRVGSRIGSRAASTAVSRSGSPGLR